MICILKFAIPDCKMMREINKFRKKYKIIDKKKKNCSFDPSPNAWTGAEYNFVQPP